MSAGTATQATAGHPLWHVAIVAGAAVALYIGIRAKEYLSKPARTSRSKKQSATTRAKVPAPVIATLAICSLLSGLIHAYVCPEHFREATIFGAFFLIAASAQLTWAAVIAYRPTQRLLLLGALGNTAIIGIWTMSRTIGVPLGPEPWKPETLAPLDIAATALELAILIGTTALVARRHITATNTGTNPVPVDQAGRNRAADMTPIGYGAPVRAADNLLLRVERGRDRGIRLDERGHALFARPAEHRGVPEKPADHAPIHDR